MRFVIFFILTDLIEMGGARWSAVHLELVEEGRHAWGVWKW